MKFPRSPYLAADPRLRLRYLSASVLALALFAGLASPANATIDNTATATGSPPSGPDVTDDSNTVLVPVAGAGPQLVVTKTLTGVNDVTDVGVYDDGDTITFNISIANTGNVTMYNVAPVETGVGNGITFNGTAGDNSFGAYLPATATIAPGASQVYTVTYTMTDSDAYRAAGIANGVSNTASATGNIGAPGGALIDQVTDVTEDTELATVPATPRIEVTKAFTLVKGGGNLDPAAEVNDTIEYVYTAVNTGNVQLTDVSITDDHENGEAGAATITPGAVVTTNTTNENLVSDGPVGTSDDTTSGAASGSYDIMRPGATVSFEYDHTVGQPEFDDQ